MLRLVEYMKRELRFDGTASWLVELLGLDIQPNILSRKLGRYRQELTKAGVTFSFSRTGKQRSLSLRYQDYDGMTAAQCGEGESSRSPESLENRAFSG